ncbi:MAG TPA: menaquinone-dependent protoporphyrinogen IX dehydrogenase, partial [Thauera sp.]|nr:menaquinone-dependent protoporphyrinogen IX dehydrogenase [Thauera sp.]
MRLLIIYSTIDGHTLEICARIAEIARAAGHEVELAEVESATAAQLEASDRVVIGASIRYGHHRPAAVSYTHL